MLHSANWFLISIVCFFLTHAVTPLSIQSTPTNSVINMEDDLLQISGLSDKHGISQVSRRGYAGDDFYQKASKSIPRMGRRSEFNLKPCSGIPQDLEENENIAKLINAEQLSFESNEGVRQKRLNLGPEDISAWPWYSDRIPNLAPKRTEISEPCYRAPKYKHYISSNEICNENMICCPIVNDASVFKRFLSSRSSKQTTTSVPDYKSNQFM